MSAPGPAPGLDGPGRGDRPVGREGWGATGSRTVVWHDPLATARIGAGLSGIDFLGALADGTLPPAPMAALLGFELVEVAPGRVVFGCTPDGSVYNPIGVVHGGLVCALADTATGCAVHTTLAAGVGYTSIDLNVSYLRPVTTASGNLRATGEVTRPGRRVAFARAEIVDSAGRLVATATGSCAVLPPVPGATGQSAGDRGTMASGSGTPSRTREVRRPNERSEPS